MKEFIKIIGYFVAAAPPQLSFELPACV